MRDKLNMYDRLLDLVRIAEEGAHRALDLGLCEDLGCAGMPAQSDKWCFVRLLLKLATNVVVGIRVKCQVDVLHSRCLV